MADAPAVYILHGDDEFGIAEFIAGIEKKMGDPATAGLNITRLEGKSTTLKELVAATHAMPFLTDRRLVVLDDPLGSLKSQADREQFKEVLGKTPGTTALVVVIPRPLVSPRDRRDNKAHWLEKWAAEQGGRAYIREYNQPHGPQMARWIQSKAAESGGEIEYQAAGLLASYVQDESRRAAQEIDKLLAYVNYRRPVQVDDVERLTPDGAQGDVFAMVDALGNRNAQLALQMLHRLLEVDEPLRLYGMVVRQFRLLLLTREMLDDGYRETEIAKALKLHPFVAKKLVPQCRNFDLLALEAIYHKLLEIDETIKTGGVEADVAMDSLFVSLTT
jgi:DNA polymerase-3 subunit delta